MDSFHGLRVNCRVRGGKAKAQGGLDQGQTQGQGNRVQVGGLEGRLGQQDQD